MAFVKFPSCMAIAGALLMSAPAFASEDYAAIATEHCNAFLKNGSADMHFALGKASAKFSEAELAEFNRRFAMKLVSDYHINPAAGCVLDMASTGTVKPDAGHKPSSRRSRAPVTVIERAVVSGIMQGQQSEPVAVAYRLERSGAQPWTIINISINGQPLVDRYRELYEDTAGQGGAEAVLDSLG